MIFTTDETEKKRQRDKDPTVQVYWNLSVGYWPANKYHLIRDNIIKIIMTVMVPENNHIIPSDKPLPYALSMSFGKQQRWKISKNPITS